MMTATVTVRPSFSVLASDWEKIKMEAVTITHVRSVKSWGPKVRSQFITRAFAKVRIACRNIGEVGGMTLGKITIKDESGKVLDIG